MAEDDEDRPFHSRILLFSNLLGVSSAILLVISMYLLYQTIYNSGLVSIGKIAVSVLLSINIVLQLMDIVVWSYIRKQTKFSHEKATQLIIFPILSDVIMIFLFGLGALFIFFRIIIYSNLNPEAGVYDNDDPLFQ